MTYPFPLANGWTTFSGWPTGSESSTNWKGLPARPTPASNFGVLRSRIVRDPNANLLEVDLSRYEAELRRLSETIDAADPDLPFCQLLGAYELNLPVRAHAARCRHRRLTDSRPAAAVLEYARCVGQHVQQLPAWQPA